MFVEAVSVVVAWVTWMLLRHTRCCCIDAGWGKRQWRLLTDVPRGCFGLDGQPIGADTSGLK